MKSIGIAQTTYDIYEMSNNIWHSVWPATPVVSVAAFVSSQDDKVAFDSDIGRADMVFREDSFDPITRIRRGRFYRASGERPSPKRVPPHPVLGVHGLSETRGDGLWRLMLYVFDQYQDSSLEKVIRIGSIESLWRVLDYERIITGEYLFTLKARHALGVLPELNAKEIPEIGREKAVELFEKLVDSAHRESASSIVDIARAFCQWCLSTRRADERGDCSLLKCDLGDIIKKFESEQDRDKVILSAARIIARLHSRAKPNEQARHSTRSVSEADAEFALATIGLILRDFGWVV